MSKKDLTAGQDNNFGPLQWQKSSFCDNADCVEVAITEEGKVAVRDSKSAEGSMLVFDDSEWGAFVKAVKHGEFDASN